MANSKYKFKFYIEWGGNFLWPKSLDKKTYKKFDVGPVTPEDLNVSTRLCEELHELESEYQGALDWNNPAGPSPWSDEQFDDFFKRLKIAYDKLCTELEERFEIEFCM